MVSETELAESVGTPGALQALAAVRNCFQAALRLVCQAFRAVWLAVLKAVQAALTALAITPLPAVCA